MACLLRADRLAMPDARGILGLFGEDVACRHLEGLGYAILARRYRRRGGEIDIIARDGQTLVFVEVKAREDAAFGGGAEAVTRLKQRRIVQLAREYVMRHHAEDRPCRFDVVAIELRAGGEPAIEVYQNAFDAA
jgi:putative endonuclease